MLFSNICSCRVLIVSCCGVIPAIAQERGWRRTEMTKPKNLGGSFTLPGTSMTLNRMGYGAMQLAGPGVWGPPRDVDGAIAVLREALDAGVNHIDTSDFYGPHA